jgi:hypothetical protein
VTKWLTLEEALRAKGDPAEVAELIGLEKEGHDGHQYFVALGAPETARERKARQYGKLRERLEAGLIAQLRDGLLVGTGRDPRLPVNAARVPLPPDRWHALELNFEDSSVLDGEVVIREVLVSSVEGSGIGTEESLAAPNVASRLVIMRRDQRVILDGVEKHLPQQSFNLLLLLAKATLNRRGYASKEDIETANSGRSAAQVVHQLKKMLARGSAKPKDMRALIETHRTPPRYSLALSVHEIELRP